MSHKVEIVEIRELSDELVSYRLRCCGEPATDSWHSASVRIADHGPALAARMAEISELHEAKRKWRAKRQTPSAGTAGSGPQT